MPSTTGKTASRRDGERDCPRLRDWEEVCGCGCEWRDSGRKQLLEQPLLFPSQRSAPRHMTGFGALRRSETDLCDSKTKAARLPGTGVTQRGEQGAGAGERLTRRPSRGALPRRPGDLAPPPSASASGWTPRSSAPASGSPEPSGSAAPDGTKVYCHPL